MTPLLIALAALAGLALLVFAWLVIRGGTIMPTPPIPDELYRYGGTDDEDDVPLVTGEVER